LIMTFYFQRTGTRERMALIMLFFIYDNKNHSLQSLQEFNFLLIIFSPPPPPN
jgi:hypothetical protein